MKDSQKSEKMKHTNDENINISMAILGKKFHEMKKESEKEVIVDVINCPLKLSESYFEG